MASELDQHDFTHIFEPGAAGAVSILLLHATGGNEQDLVPLTRHLAPDSAVLSVRGKVVENGKARYFRRFAEGVFDLEDLHGRTLELLEFLKAAVLHYHLESGRLVILGYSNGANIGANLVFTMPQLFAGAALIRPTVTHERKASAVDLSGRRILLLGAAEDERVPADAIHQLAGQFSRAAARVTSVVHLDATHSLCQDDFKAVKAFISQFARR